MPRHAPLPDRRALAAISTALTAIGALGLLACATPATPATSAQAPRAGAPRVVVMISASAEWKIFASQHPGETHPDTPYGPWMAGQLGGRDVVYFHGGYGKVSAAAATQYAIDRWRPTLLVNLGTCGGFGGERKVGDVVLATDTYVYDIVELMGSADEAIEDFHTRIDTARWPAPLAARVIRGPIVSGDRDLDPGAVAGLAARFGASVGDWESGSIAWVATHNRTPVVVLRGVTDLVDPHTGDPTYHAPGAWERASVAVMASLVSLLGEAMPALAP